jgi:hypothetical protein
MTDFKVVQPLTIRDPARFRGPLSSSEFNQFQDNVVGDITNLSTAVNSNAASIRAILNEIQSENLYLKRRIQSLEESFDYREVVFGKANLKIDRYLDFHDTSRFVFPTNLSAEKAAPFKGQFGEVSLPINAVENKFYNFRLRTSEVVVPDSLFIQVDGQFDKLDGNGIQDYELGGKISHGDPKKAFNGINEQAWIRSATFPLDSDVDQIEVQLTAVVPAGISSSANLIEVVPFPEGSVDIMQLATSPTLDGAFVSVDGFTEKNNLTATRYHFPARSVEQVRIRLRCRNWREINGKKVFQYGLQELGMKLVDYNKAFLSSDNFGENPTCIVKITSPRNHVFNRLLRVDPNPNFLLEDHNKRHVRLRITTSIDFSEVIWDSSLDDPPQLGVSTGLTLRGVNTLYAIYTMQYVKNSGGLGSPYIVGTTPSLKGLGLVFSATAINGNE